MAYERKCPNWLIAFNQWVAPRAESPENFIFWAGVFTISSALRRRVFIGQKTLGGWTCYPHTYTMFVAPPGMRKTTTMGFAIELLSSVDTLTKPPTLVTKEALVDGIIQSPDSSLYLAIEEFSDLIMKGGKEMYELLTSLFDAKKELSVGTMMRGREGTERPCVNMLAATTPEWISANMPAAAIGGGFASRVMFIYENQIRNKGLLRKKVMQDFNFEAFKIGLVQDLNHIAENISGEFTLTPEAEEFVEQWYQETDFSKENKKLQGYYQRKPTHLLKLAQIISISYKDELVITKQDLEVGLGILKGAEKNLLRVFEGVGKNTYSLEMADLADFIKAVGEVPESELLEHFKTSAEPNKLQELINGLVLMRQIGKSPTQGGGWTIKYTGGATIQVPPTTRQ
jgi:hypothetical protein